MSIKAPQLTAVEMAPKILRAKTAAHRLSVAGGTFPVAF